MIAFVRIAAVLIALALVAAACSGGSSDSVPKGSASSGGGSAASAPGGSTGPAADADPQARRVAVHYAEALGLGRARAARALSAPSDAAAGRTLRQFQRFLDAIPIARIDAQPSPVSLPAPFPAEDVGVMLDLRARLSRHALTDWVPLGQRALVLAPHGTSWRVDQDATHSGVVTVVPSGLALFEHPHFLTGTRATVVYGLDSAAPEARTIRSAADSTVPHIAATYGGGPAAARPLIFLVKDREQGQQLIGHDIGQTAVLGTVSDSFTYVFMRQYRRVDDVSQSSSVTGMMTLLATRVMFRHVPTSLQQGVASYEENAYLNGRGFLLPLDGIAVAYPGYPTLKRWTTTDSLWGLEGHGQQLAGQDALAMGHVIISSHGGVAALKRLGRAFRNASGGDFTPAQVRAAFRRALHASFDQVVSEAHAYVAGGSWKFG